MLYISATANSVYDMAHVMNRADQLGGWDGIKALVEYYEELSESMGKGIEIDIIAWCCDWTHYGDEDELLVEYGSLEDAMDETTVLELEDGGYLVLNH